MKLWLYSSRYALEMKVSCSKLQTSLEPCQIPVGEIQIGDFDLILAFFSKFRIWCLQPNS